VDGCGSAPTRAFQASGDIQSHCNRSGQTLNIIAGSLAQVTVPQSLFGSPAELENEGDGLLFEEIFREIF
jgi:hypothetical protein